MSGIFKAIGNIFGGGQSAPPPMPAPPEPPPIPTVDEAARAQGEADAARRRKGRAAMILTGPEGAGSPRSAAKTLLGG